MKHSILMCLALGVTVIFFGCSTDDLMDLESVQSDQEVSTLKSMKNGNVKTEFTGTSNFVAPGEPGTTIELPNGKTKVKGQTVVWYDEVDDDSRLSGISNWTANWLIEDEFNAKLWGKCEILVGTHPDHPELEQTGKWEISWHGYQTQTPGGFIVVCDAVGQGKSGEVKGLVAHWTYTMDIADGFFYKTKGYILSKK